ncbi:cAMP-binding domain of CRP or a regulatory subunit of cAMP-dependent protein kinases [Lutibacter oricola]|uniref:cAMP-binding domain of CRP or a regulatory subunit of cAMP-dependent protein kinases n=1 Tax=Lutibacter oricola TaxID=762486 RepID=A0A1H3FUY4_9FLAO|nr:Crp/Fnr family transcriptional regulator [Lutibacter oricola]SDX94913.1 cAMP-binding domain of CRP or a regulatory subunit of cAMP-dependent protein kinases [Lutibacter oricola]
MPYSFFKNSIRSSVQISDSDLAEICTFFKAKTVNKSEFLLEQGKTCKFEGFVQEGCFRVFTIDKKGNESTLYFAGKGWWLMDVDSFMNQTPSDLNMEALEDSKVLIIQKKDKEYLYNQLPIVEKLFRIMSQKALIAWQKRLIQNHSLTAKERYFHFIEKYPTIASKLKGKQISSYLGITHEFLSKIKNK